MPPKCSADSCLLILEEAIIEVGWWWLSTTSTINGNPWKRTVSKSYHLQVFYEARLRLTNLAFDGKLHAQSDKEHVDVKPLMQRPGHTSAVGMKFLSISMEFCHFLKGSLVEQSSHFVICFNTRVVTGYVTDLRLSVNRS
jgi:hypothetical protein